MCTYLFKLEFSSFPDVCPGVGLLDHMVTIFTLLRNIHPVFHSVYAPVLEVWAEGTWELLAPQPGQPGVGAGIGVGRQMERVT